MFKTNSAYFILAMTALSLVGFTLVFLSPIGQIFVVFLFISIIGIPVAMALAVIPPLAIVLAFAAIFAWPFRKSGWPVVALAFIPAIAAMFIVPVVHNMFASQEARALVESDKTDGVMPFAGQSLAIFVKPRHSQECLDFCQRALVSSGVKTFIVASSDKTWPHIDLGAQGTAYFLEKRPSCEPVKLRDKVSDYPVLKDAPSPAPALRLLMAAGTCLIAEQRKITDADAVLHYAEMVENRFDRHSLSPFFVPMRALRMAWYVRDGDGFSQTFQPTAVDYWELWKFLFPTLSGGAELRMYAGLQREHRKLGALREDVNLDAFLMEKLKISLEFDSGAAGEARNEALGAALRQSTDLTSTQQALVGDVFKDIAPDAKMADEAQLEKAVAVLSDPRVEIPEYLGRMVEAAYKSGPQSREKAMDAYFTRLEATLAPVPRSQKIARRAALTRLSFAAREIPDSDFANRWPRLRIILSDPEAVSIFKDEISRVKLAGKAAHADLLRVIDAASPPEGDVRGRDKYPDGNRYIALGGICRMGLQAKELLPELELRIRSGAIPLSHSSEIRVAAHTIRELGGDIELVRKSAKPGSGRNDFEMMLTQTLEAVSRRKGCY